LRINTSDISLGHSWFLFHCEGNHRSFKGTFEKFVLFFNMSSVVEPIAQRAWNINDV